MWHSTKLHTFSALIFAGLNFRMAKISRDLIREIWLNSQKFMKYKSHEISRKLQTAKIAYLEYREIRHKKRHKRPTKYILKSANREIREIQIRETEEILLVN